MAAVSTQYAFTVSLLSVSIADEVHGFPKIFKEAGALFHEGVDRPIEHQIHFAHELGEVAAEALLEAVEAVEGVVLADVAADAPVVVNTAMLLDGPLDHAPLETDVEHADADGVGGVSVKVAVLVAWVYG